MKKALSILLAAVLMLVLVVPTFAASDVGEDGKGTADKPVTATYTGLVDDENVATVYFVTVAWNVDSSLAYSDGTTTYTWNATDTKYVANPVTGKGWTGDATVEITVTNKSNAEITATASWDNAAGITAECAFADADKIDLESAAKDVEVADGETGEAKTGTITATVDTPAAGTISRNDAPVGTITVSIAPKA